jgi:response regulator of citrate/malate metabolism
MFRSDAKQLAEAISETQSIDARREGKRSGLSTLMLQAGGVLEFISSRYFPFTVDDLAEDMEMSDRQARRILKSVETMGWVEKTKEKRPSEAVVNGGSVGQHYRTLVRIRRL